MKKHKNNMFAEKFRLLSSQESGEINWSSSDSSEFENIPSNADRVCNFPKRRSKKRKRKDTIPKNLSNLNITVIDLTKDHKEATKNKQLDISTIKCEVNTDGIKSPILGSTQCLSPYKYRDAPKSPVLMSKGMENPGKVDQLLKSPILILKSASPKLSPNGRKKLFKSDNLSINNVVDVSRKSKSLILNENHCLDRRKLSKSDTFSTVSIKTERDSNMFKNQKILLANDISAENRDQKEDKRQDQDLKRHIIAHIKMEDIKCSKEDLSQEICVINETPEPNMDLSMSMLRTSSVDLVNKVKKYFDNNFSSGSPSQQTISEISTPRNHSKSSDDVEIINSITQVVSNKNSTESMKQEDFVDTDKKDKKKIRYKKDGLAYRLNTLLKKKTASISLWQHERFLAANSNFVIPKGEFIAFRICKVSFKYSCHLLEVMDLNDSYCLILIHSNNSLHNNFSEDDVFKLYEPYKIVDFNNCQLIVNVTKFECITLKKQC